MGLRTSGMSIREYCALSSFLCYESMLRFVVRNVFGFTMPVL
jgi:hypothetical protein